MITHLLIIILVYVLPPSVVTGEKIKIGAVLPADPTMLFSIPRVTISAKLAIESLYQRNLLPGHSISIGYRDSRCSEAFGMKEAIDSVVEDKVNVLFGPVCDYSAAPVARQVTFWNMPMVSVGSVALDFFLRRDTVYPLLTRAGPANFKSLAFSIFDTMKMYNWTKVKLLYDKAGHSDILPVFCHLVGDSIVSTLPGWVHLDYHRFNPSQDYSVYEEMLLTEVAMDYAGKLG